MSEDSRRSPTTSGYDTTEPSSSEPRSLSRDDAYHILQNKRRRAVLRYLLSHDRERFVMRDVAEVIAAWEHDTTVRKLTSKERQRVYIALYQSHLPKLAEHGLIDYDQPRGTILVNEFTSVLEPFLGVEYGLDAPETLSVTDDGGSHDRRSDDGGSHDAASASEGLLSRLGI